jgi:(p)ppGpp synthase/HD superfamily hydrolase
MTDLLSLAQGIAIGAHAGQVDRAGVPYIMHPWAVAQAVSGFEEKILAWLHDVVEDTDVTLEDLAWWGFPESTVLQVDALTHRKNEPRSAYYARVMEWPAARRVKIADVRHNLGRLGGLPAEEQGRLRAKYEKALRVLLEGVAV